MWSQLYPNALSFGARMDFTALALSTTTRAYPTIIAIGGTNIDQTSTAFFNGQLEFHTNTLAGMCGYGLTSSHSSFPAFQMPGPLAPSLIPCSWYNRIRFQLYRLR